MRNTQNFDNKTSGEESLNSRSDDNKRYLKETGCDNVKYAGDSPQKPPCDLQYLIRRLSYIFVN